MTTTTRRPFNYNPPKVAWVEDPNGHHPEPPPNPAATELESLRYEAALVTARSGIDCRIGQLNSPDTYDYAIYGNGQWFGSGNCGNYWQARMFLHGIEIGAKAHGHSQ